MKKLLTFAALSLCALAIFAPVASAQTMVTAKVPFAFIVDGQLLPAGEYRVVPSEAATDVLQIINADGNAVALSLVDSIDVPRARSADPCTFQFRKVGDHYFLSQIDIEGEASLRIPLTDKDINAALASITATASPTTR